jgi:hypothetical protein
MIRTLRAGVADAPNIAFASRLAWEERRYTAGVKPLATVSGTR